ncbi:MAG TPA: acyl carrier protein [Streptosporangiaceae bacterium]|nr:acyl carrier protein [Streptosporangiaceae bacterium]
MSAFTLDELADMLRSCAGEAEQLELDRTFEELGYDSLAVMEVASQIERRYGVSIAEDELAEAENPRLLIEAVNSSLATVGE